MGDTPRNFPIHTLQDALRVAQRISDDMAGKPYKRLLLAEALGIKPGSSKYRDLLSSSYKYGLTDGTEKAPQISLTGLGQDATQEKDAAKRRAALRKAALFPKPFREFYETYKDRKIPVGDTMRKLLTSEFKVPVAYTEEGAAHLLANGRFVDIVRDIGGAPHILLDGTDTVERGFADDPDVAAATDTKPEELSAPTPPKPADTKTPERPLAIFIGHGKKRGPLEKIQKILTQFQIPHKVVIEQANLGRPISQKVKQTMLECGSAILIFTCDEKLLDEAGNEVWRPSENVVHELGAASYAYEDRVMIFKEKGITFPTNFKDVGYIEFEEDKIEAKTMELLKELIGFGLVKITTAS